MRSIFLVLFIALLSSCGKVFKTTVKGRVLNPVTGTGIENARVILQKAGSGIPSGLKTVEAVYTDANGNFEISARKFKSLTASVILDGSEYYTIGWKEGGNDYSVLSPKKGEITEADFHAVPYGNLKIAVHNVNCQGSNDTLHFERNYITDPNNSVFLPFTFTGCYDNNGAFAKVPSGYYNIKWTVIRSGISNTYEQQILVPGNGNYEMVINY